jgi:hypothetical protein
LTWLWGLSLINLPPCGAILNRYLKFMAAKKFDPNQFVHFVYLTPKTVSYGFSGYQDESGEVKFISYSKDPKTGDPIKYYFNFGMKDRVIRVNKDKKDLFGNSVVEFLRNCPECKGSRNGSYAIDEVTGETVQEGVIFKEMNEESDAEKAIEAKEYRLKAETLAANLKGEDIYDVAALLGIFGKESLVRHAIMEVAGNRPPQFMDAYDNPNRQALALIKKGLAKNVLENRGGLVLWNKTTIGVDEAEAASAVLKDKKLFEGLANAIKKVS